MVGSSVKNLWGTVPSVIEMQSEGGAAGVIHVHSKTQRRYIGQLR